MLEIFVTTLAQSLAPMIASVIVTYVAILARRYLKVQIEEKDARTLHSALTTGMNMAARRAVGGRIDPLIAVDYVRDIGAPDAVRRLKLSPLRLEELAETKLALPAQ